MKVWVWVLAVADTEDRIGNCVSVFKDRATAQVAFRDALKRYGGNRRYDMCLKQVTSVDTFLNSHPQYKPEPYAEPLPA
jgi:hypothetical protein